MGAMPSRIDLIASLAAILLSTSAVAREEPLWEAGLGVAGLHFPHYRGSDQSRNYALPLPYFVYRGEILKADREGVRGIFFKTDRVDMNLSVGASLPVRSSDSRAREGMPNLRPSLELGPSVDINLWRAPDRVVKLDLRLPLRAGVSVSSHPDYIGLHFFPHLNVDVRDPLGMQGWNLGVLTGPVYTDARYSRYFYSVPREFATAQRPAYEAGGGYAGTQFIVALSKRFRRFWLGGFARYDTLRGAVFEESPLVTSKRYVAAGIGISWESRASASR